MPLALKEHTEVQQALAAVHPNGNLDMPVEALEDVLRKADLYETWNRVERIVIADIGAPLTLTDKALFAVKRNQLFLRACQGEIDLGPLEALYDID